MECNISICLGSLDSRERRLVDLVDKFWETYSYEVLLVTPCHEHFL